MGRGWEMRVKGGYGEGKLTLKVFEKPFGNLRL